MCGFAGIFSHAASVRASLDADIGRMNDTLQHRGPDAGATWSDPAIGIALGFRRLAILDLSPLGMQPMRSPSGRYTVVFNGEVYNHHELRRELGASGVRFRGHSDTEAIVAACDSWGVARTIPRLDGMFALAIWDAEARSLTLVRDQLGKKPLYIARAGQTLLFASELKAIHAHPAFTARVSLEAVDAYLRRVYVPGPASIYQDVSKLPPASYVTIHDPAAPLPEPTQYWSLRDVAAKGRPQQIADPQTALRELSTTLDAAVRDRLESDVPIGAMLSGGIDSSLVVARMQALSASPIKTYTIGFDQPEWDESAASAAVARHLGTEHHTMPVTGGDALAVVPELPEIFDEPLADPSQVPTVLVCRLCRRDVTVALCGDGGDEFFGGYNRYRATDRLYGFLRPLPQPLRHVAYRAAYALPADRWDDLARRALPAKLRPRILGEKLQKLGAMLHAATPAAAYATLLNANQSARHLLPGVTPAADPVDALFAMVASHSFVEQMMFADQNDYLPDDLLAKMDRASMAASLEVRAPLLDRRIIELSWRLHPSLKLRGTTTKWILRELLARDVPRALFERPKMGFSIPVRAWLTGPLRPWAEDLVAESTVRQYTPLDAGAVRADWQRLLDGRAGNGFGMWSVLQFIAWCKRWNPRFAGG